MHFILMNKYHQHTSFCYSLLLGQFQPKLFTVEITAKTLHRMSLCTPVSIPAKITWYCITILCFIDQPENAKKNFCIMVNSKILAAVIHNKVPMMGFKFYKVLLARYVLYHITIFFLHLNESFNLLFWVSAITHQDLAAMLRGHMRFICAIQEIIA